MFVVRDGHYTKQLREHHGKKTAYYSKVPGSKEKVITKAEFEDDEAGNE